MTLELMGMHRKIWISSFAGLLALSVLGCGQSYDDLVRHAERQQSQFAPVIRALHEYHAKFGVYPSAISDLSGLELPILQTLANTRLDGPRYEVSRDRSFFRINYGFDDLTTSDSHPYATYLSLNRGWILTRNNNRFAHVEAKHYGALFARDGSAESLRLTTSSLLDTATSTFRCQMFWKTWLTDSLGEGTPIADEYPDRTPKSYATAYSSVDRTMSYVFIVEDRDVKAKKPIPVVVRVYRVTGKAAKKDWHLLNNCDKSS